MACFSHGIDARWQRVYVHCVKSTAASTKASNTVQRDSSEGTKFTVLTVSADLTPEATHTKTRVTNTDLAWHRTLPPPLSNLQELHLARCHFDQNILEITVMSTARPPLRFFGGRGSTQIAGPFRFWKSAANTAIKALKTEPSSINANPRQRVTQQSRERKE